MSRVLVPPEVRGGPDMSRPNKEPKKRGPPFLIIGGAPYVNLSFHLDPRGPDVRQHVAVGLEIAAHELHVFRRLTPEEARLFRRPIDDAEAEAWARIVRYR